jgi:glycosyltransferase involved in cell wall biosynthesis
VRARIATFRDMGFWRTPAKVRQLRLVYPHFDGFIANSTAVARHVHDADRIPLDAIEVIPNGVRIPAAVAPTDANPLVVGIVANLDRPVKRVDLFVEAAARIHAVIPASTFVIVGDGPLRPALQAQAERLGVGHVMHFAGSTPTAMDEILRFSVGMLCSDSEGLSNALLEYMACGVPAVARNVGGNAEAVHHGSTGILVEDSTADALAGAVVELLTDPVRRQRMAAHARQIAEERFSIPACVRRHQKLYDRLLLARATRGATAIRNAVS